MTVDLRLGDCLDILPTLPDKSVDAIITDLPYGTTACKWDVIIPLDEMWKQVKRICRGAFVTTSDQPFTSVLVVSRLDWFKYKWTWNKVNRITGYLDAKRRPLRVCEDVLVFSENGHTYNPQMTPGKKYNPLKPSEKQTANYGKHTVKRFTNGEWRYPQNWLEIAGDERGTVGRIHPTQKPVALYEYLIKTYTNEGDTVLDFCMGSGTTGVACINTGRDFIGMEKDAGYFAVAERRIIEASRQEVMPL